MLNHTALMGRMTADPLLRYTGSGIPVVSFTLAVEQDVADKQTGQRKTDFLNVVAWRGTAEFAARYFRKGSMTVVTGRLTSREWTDNNGNKRRATEVVADQVYFGEGRKKESDGPSPAGFAPVEEDDPKCPF